VEREIITAEPRQNRDRLAQMKADEESEIADITRLESKTGENRRKIRSVNLNIRKKIKNDIPFSS
jgi:hypothetical protein